MFQNIKMQLCQKITQFAHNKAHSINKGGSISCMYITTLLCLIPLIITAAILKLCILSQNNLYTIYIDTQDGALFTVDEKYLSLGLDSTIITEGFPHFNVTDPTLIQMMKYLSPAYIRIGGNQADQIVFSRHGDNNFFEEERKNGSDAYTLLGSDWLNMYNLAKESNLRVIYDLNSLLRFENGSWNSANAEEMLTFSQENQLSLDWELGNEPNSYEHKFGTYVNATQLGFDFNKLRDILNSFEIYKDSLLIGPSTTRLSTPKIKEYFLDFLKTGVDAVNAITFHHYYFGGQDATWEEFLDPTNFDYLEKCIKDVKKIIDLLPSVNKPIWLGETSSAWHSGAPNMSDRFIGSFLWIDKLGLSAKLGIDIVVRQSIFKGNYALINDTYYPNPDWWLSILYKKLVGRKVIATQTEGSLNIRLYAHCAIDNPLWNNGSAVVVFGVNLSDKIGYVQVKELKSDQMVYVYEFTSNDTLFSQFVKVNDDTLRLGKHLELPDFNPKVIKVDSSMEMPKYSIVFWVFTNTDVEFCKN